MRKIFLMMLMLSAALMMNAQSGKIQVTGVVTDEKGDPMVGVVVVDKANSKNGTVTDMDGKFRLNVLPDAFLEFSFISYNPVLENVNGRNTVDVRMTPSSEMLEGTVVIGYGESKKGDLTGSVSVVEMDGVQSAPVTSVAQALQGRIAGAEFSAQTGEPGEAGTIQIRGSRSISAGNEPLIVVDGVMDAVTDLSEINPADIVSISVLKDVSSTAIYGSRGANGVILVTTKDTDIATGSFIVNFKGSVGVSSIYGGLDTMNAKEYATWRNMVSYAKSNYSSTWKEPFDPTAYQDGTDWIDVLSRTSVYQNYHLSLKGNYAGTVYSASIGYHDNPGILIGSGVKKYSGLFWIDSKLGKNLRWGLRASYVYTDIDRTNAAVSGTNTSAAIYLSPILTPEDTWNRYGSDESAGGAPFNNPYLLATNVTNKKFKRDLNIAPWIRWEVTKGLDLQAKFSYTSNAQETGYYSPSYLPVASANQTGGTASRSTWRREKMIIELTGNYKKKIKGHDIAALVGFTGEYGVTDYQLYKGVGYTDDSLKYFNMSGLQNPANLSTSTNNQIVTKMSALGRLNYNYKRRYYATLTMRADGASNFAVGNKWGFFPAAALRWSIMNETWFNKTWWLNDLSIRLSAGRSGNDAIASYMSLATLTSEASNWLFGDSKQLVYVPKKLDNSDLTWETTDSYNVGFNFSVLKNRITLEADAYLSNTRDLLLPMKNSQTTGYDTYYTNIGMTRNIGCEFTLTTVNLDYRKFKWSTTLTVSHNNQRVIDVGNDGEVVPTLNNPRTSSQYLYGYKNGYPVNALWGYQYEGVWQTQEQIDRNNISRAYVSQLKDGANGSNLGRSKYADINHDGVLDQDDMVYLGSSDAVIYGGFQNDFKIMKNLSVGVYFTYSLGGYIYNLSELWMASGNASTNKYRNMLNAWTPENPYTDVVKPGFDDLQGSSKHVYDASYIRLKSVDINYDFSLSRKARKVIKSLSVGVSAENLWLWKKYTGFDPDVNSDSNVYRVDNGAYPRPRTVVFNLKMSF